MPSRGGANFNNNYLIFVKYYRTKYENQKTVKDASVYLYKGHI